MAVDVQVVERVPNPNRVEILIKIDQRIAQHLISVNVLDVVNNNNHVPFGRTLRNVRKVVVHGQSRPGNPQISSKFLVEFWV